MTRFGIVSASWMTDASLSMEARALYAILATYCNNKRTCFPSTETLMKSTGASRATIFRWLKELETHQLIRKIHERRRRIIMLGDQLFQDNQ